MNLLRTLRVALLITASLTLWAQEPIGPAVVKLARSHFKAVDVFVDSGAQPLAAYQLDFSTTTGNARIVGIEGGEHPAFSQPPYYDPQAMQRERAVLAAFNTVAADKLPKGKTRVATIHVEVSGERSPKFDLKLHTAADANGQPISVQTSFAERNTR
jgi:hypothetical protein